MTLIDVLILCFLTKDIYADGSKIELWWKNKGLWRKSQFVDPNFSWDKRQTGVSPDWSAGLGIWKHYNRTELLDRPLNPIPWTSGRMCKFLRQAGDDDDNDDDDSSFELKSIYERSSAGLWVKGLMKERGDVDNHLQHGYTFQKCPYRISNLPVQLPKKMIKDGAAANRVTIVQPNAGTISGTRWLPSERQMRKIRSSNGKYSRFVFFELWLSETFRDQPEARKIGMFCQYDGVTGEIVQMFRMKEVKMPEDMTPSNPDQEQNFDKLERKIRKYYPWSSTTHLESDMAKALRQGKSPSECIESAQWESFEGRVVRTKYGSHVESEFAYDVKENAPSLKRYYSPADENPDLFIDCRFDDGVYCRLPKNFYQNLKLNNHPTCLELGCITQSGDFHRIFISESKNGKDLSYCVYEKWRRNAE